MRWGGGVKGKPGVAMVVLLALPIGLPEIRMQEAPPAKEKPSSKSTRTGKATNKPARTQSAPTIKKLGDAQRTRALAELRNSFVQISAGELMMGSENDSSDEKPVHRVRISHPFEMGKYEVTQAQWEAVTGINRSRFKGANLPVTNISWHDVQEFIKKLNVRNHGYIYRLPTEAEWEYACRAGSTGEYSGNLDAMAWYHNNSGGTTHPVGTKQPNAWGLYDMHGNVAEWCQDRYSIDYYSQSPSVDPIGPSTGSDRVIREGDCLSGALRCRSAARNGFLPDKRGLNFVGFRLVRTLR
jgi:formylglycine-generating enzyme required for sulfatase activity